MEVEHKKPRYPENLFLKEAVRRSGMKIKNLAEKIGCSTVILSNTVNGHYKGTNIKPALMLIIRDAVQETGELVQDNTNK